jgi:bacterioferritin
MPRSAKSPTAASASTTGDYAMKGDPKVIEYLNQCLTNELTAINQYWLHYRVLDNWGVEAGRLRTPRIDRRDEARRQAGRSHPVP